MIDAISSALHEAVARTDFGGVKNVLGVLILARCEPGGYFRIESGQAAHESA